MRHDGNGLMEFIHTTKGVKMNYSTDFPQRFIEAIIYSWVAKLLFSVSVLSGILAILLANPIYPITGWILFSMCILSATAFIIYLYPESW